ncbi:MAG: glycoside hydrolase family 3 C-terminal domain-containing protein [Kiritimatiellae bacterium]|nr:glycoside hydrolase family 3 C-terminal domain-containing protein [Kiritimatiellia bacterium]
MDARVEELLSRMTLEEKTALLTGDGHLETRANERLGIPQMKMADGPHGVRDGQATCFPTAVAMGATWNPDLVREFGGAIARELRAKGRQIILGPCINIHRTPLGGRNFESFTEDPHLAARLAVAYVQGVQAEGAATSVKHFACNNQEWERLTISSEVDERTLREIYLPAFKAAVQEGGAWTVMGAYNRVNGTYCCENEHLLIDILKREWGFDGLVVSDWGAVHSTVPSAHAGLDLEMPGPGRYFAAPLAEAVRKGEVSEAVLDEKVRRILGVMLKVGLLDGRHAGREGEINSKRHQDLARRMAREAIVLLKNERSVLPIRRDALRAIAVIGPNAMDARLGGGGSSTVFPPYAVGPLEGLKTLCGRQVAVHYARGCVMPADLKPIESAALLPPGGEPGVHGLKGEYFDNLDLAGEPKMVRMDAQLNFSWGGIGPTPEFAPGRFSVRWTGKLVPPQTSRYEIGMSVDEGVRLYLDGKKLFDHWHDRSHETRTIQADLEAGREYDVCVEFREDRGWSWAQLCWLPTGDLLREAEEVARSSDAAIVCVGLSYSFEGEGVDRKRFELPPRQVELIKTVSAANPNTVVVLVNGSPVAMDPWLDEVPAVLEAWYAGQEGGHAIAEVLLGEVNPSGRLPTTFPRRLADSPAHGTYPGRDGKVRYSEGVLVGYRHFDTRGVEPLFAFGHGLSYTTFAYHDLCVSPARIGRGEKVEVSLDIENTGDRDGQEVVQLYVRDVAASLERPPKELKAFRKVSLRPGQRAPIRFEITTDDLSFYDPARGGWTAEPGQFEVLAGSSARDIRAKAGFELAD